MINSELSKQRLDNPPSIVASSIVLFLILDAENSRNCLWLFINSSTFFQTYVNQGTTVAGGGGGLLLALSASLAGCNRDKVAPELPQPTEAVSAAQDNRELEVVAKALAKTLGEDAGTRQFLKQEALKRFDGDYDVLYGPFAVHHTDFSKHLATNVSSASSDEIAMGAVLRRIPNLNISVPVHIDTWDAEKLAPLVVFIPIGFSERTTKQIKAYDQYGQAQWLDAKQAPDFPIVVVGYSERITKEEAAEAAPGTIPKGKFGTNKIVDSESGGGGGGGSPILSGGCRTDKQTEFLRTMWMRDVSWYESWILGDPEIRLQIKSPVGVIGGSPLYEALFVMSRRTIENTWYDDSNLYYWNKASIGDAQLYLWVEQDGGPEITVSTTIKAKDPTTGAEVSSTISFTIKNDDDQIGFKRMDFEDCPSQGFYALGGGDSEFRWRLENRP